MAESSTQEIATPGQNAPSLGAFLGHPDRMVSRLGALLSPALVPAPALRWAEDIAEALPSAFEAFGFEAHLGRSVADFALRVNLSAPGMLALDRAFAPGGPLHAAAPLHGWATLRATARDLLRTDSRLRRDISALWVTFERPDAEPEPALHACLDAGLVMRGETAPLDSRGALRMQAALFRLWETWRAPVDDPLPRESLRRIASWLTGRGRLAHVSFAPGRGTGAWKASLMIRRDALSDFLREIGWEGDRARLARILDGLYPAVENLRTSLTAGTGPERRLGFELFSGAPREDGVERAGALEHLAGLGLCTPAEKNALRAWHGVHLESDPHSGRLFLAARNWYVKVILDAEGRLSCKAYLTWVPAAPENTC
jgi:hypothetical protein